jgi:hypothetical protein
MLICLYLRNPLFPYSTERHERLGGVTVTAAAGDGTLSSESTLAQRATSSLEPRVE